MTWGPFLRLLSLRSDTPVNVPIDDVVLENISNGNPTVINGAKIDYDTVVTVLTNFEERKTIQENIAFSEIRTAVQRYVRNYIYFPQVDGYLRFSFHRALRALKDNMLSILEHTLTELSSFRFIISVDSIFVQYDPEVGVVTDTEIVKNSSTPQVVLPSNRSVKSFTTMVKRSMEMLYIMFENNKLKATDYTFFSVDNITLNILNFVPRNGKSYFEMYGALKSRTHCIQNIKNDPINDPAAIECFKNCINAHFYNKDQTAKGTRVRNDINRINTFTLKSNNKIK